MPKRNYEQMTRSHLFMTRRHSKEVDEWEAFKDSRSVVEPGIADLSRFMDFLVDEASPSMLTTLSTIHSYEIERGSFSGQDKAN